MFSNRVSEIPNLPARQRRRSLVMFVCFGVAALAALTWYHSHTPVALLRDHYPNLVFVTTEVRASDDGATALCSSAWPRGASDGAAKRVIALPYDGGYLAETSSSESPTPEQIVHFAENWSAYCNSTRFKPAGTYSD